ncbi:MAG TPA: hypothetical protein VGQ18_12130 [Gemmatimonadales bacterium]|jgi:hypothetical protein|nr:hypothetical protein [Gemmatimonadales bacterium]
MTRTLVWSSFAVLLSLSCSDPLGPKVIGHWTGPGIEFTSTFVSSELRLPCVEPVHVVPGVRLGADRRIQLSGTLTSYWYSTPFTFSGEARGDTLRATLVMSTDRGPVSQDYVLTTDGDFGGWACLA